MSDDAKKAAPRSSRTLSSPPAHGRRAQREVEAGNEVPAVANAFLVQLGAHTAARYAELTNQLDLTPAHTSVLQLIAQHAGLSQQTLALHLGVVPSKIVILVDDLESRRLLERHRSTTDRRNYALQLTSSGQDVLEELQALSYQHEMDITAALTESERHRLIGLLQKIAEQQGLTADDHMSIRSANTTSATTRRKSPLGGNRPTKPPG